MNTKYSKAYIQKLINVNPVAITVNRKVLTPDAYGGNTETVQTLPSQTVGIFSQIKGASVVADKGIALDETLSLLALGDANLQKDDIFNYSGQKIRIANLTSYKDICKQGTLEVIGDA
jgi:hypothetical protein